MEPTDTAPTGAAGAVADPAPQLQVRAGLPDAGGAAAALPGALARKARRHRVVADVRMTPERALRYALGKAARDVLKLSVGVLRLDLSVISIGEVLELPLERALLCMMQGPGDGLGLVALDPEALAGVIEQQTMGKVGGPPPAPRLPTRTDAAMCADFVDRMLSELDAALASLDSAAWARGWRYASFLDDPRPLALLLEDRAHNVFRLRVALGDGGRVGALTVVLPTRAPVPGRAGAAGSGAAALAAAAPPGVDPAARAAQGWQAALNAAVMGAPAELDAVLSRLRLPIADVLALVPGTLLRLPGAALDRVALVGPGRDGGGAAVALGRLGQNRGHRALRLTLPEEPEPPPA